MPTAIFRVHDNVPSDHDLRLYAAPCNSVRRLYISAMKTTRRAAAVRCLAIFSCLLAAGAWAQEDSLAGHAPEQTPYTAPLDGRVHGQVQPEVVEAGTVIDGKGNVLHDTRILIENGKIVSIGPSLRNPPDAIVYDLRHATVLPGLIDVHVHPTFNFGVNGRYDDTRETKEQRDLIDERTLWEILMGGFTTVQSVGAPEDATLRDFVQRGWIPGPRILTSLEPIVGSPEVGSDDVLRAKTILLQNDRADLVKIFASKSIRDGAVRNADPRATPDPLWRSEQARPAHPAACLPRLRPQCRAGRLYRNRARHLRYPGRPEADG
jgi:hypothetical protein